MSGHSLNESAREPAADDAVLGAVDAARRRLRLVRMARVVAVATPAGVAAGAALALAGWAPVWTPAALGVLGATVAGAWAAARTPSSSAVARVLDERLELRDRVAAALQLRQAEGAVAILVARDAAARLAGVEFAAIFPLAIGRGPAVAAAVAAALVGWLASSQPAGERSLALRASLDSRTSAGAESGRRARGGSRAPAGTVEQAAAPRTTATREHEPRSDPRNGGQSSREASSATTPGTPPTQSPVEEGRERTLPQATEGPKTAAAGVASGPAGRSGRRGSAAGQAQNGALTEGAGGTAPGNALAPGPSRGRPAQPPAGSYRAARASAEAALARDVIPPDYREHVRAYFRAMGQGGSR